MSVSATFGQSARCASIPVVDDKPDVADINMSGVDGLELLARSTESSKQGRTDWFRHRTRRLSCQ
jgi:hypothetical protein